MPLDPSKTLSFDSWDQLLQWLPEAREAQLMVVFVWAGELEWPAGEAARAAQVRKEAFELLVRKTRTRLISFLTQRLQCRDLDLAEDLVQQVWIKLFLRGGQFDPGRSFWGWIYQITRNEYIDHLRRLPKGLVSLTGPQSQDWEQLLEPQAPEESTPDWILEDKEQQEQLKVAIESLPHLQRTIVRLKCEGVKGKDIADQLGISQAYVSQLYKEAGEVLREAVER